MTVMEIVATSAALGLGLAAVVNLASLAAQLMRRMARSALEAKP